MEREHSLTQNSLTRTVPAGYDEGQENQRDRVEGILLRKKYDNKFKKQNVQGEG